MQSDIANLRDRLRLLVARVPVPASPAALLPARTNGRIPQEHGTQHLLREVAMLKDRVHVLSCRLDAERDARAALREDHVALQGECAALRARAETLVEVIEALHANLEDLRSFRDLPPPAPPRPPWSRLAPIRGSGSARA